MDSIVAKLPDLSQNQYLSIFSPLWTPKGIFNSYLVLTWVICFWEVYLKYRQHCLAKRLSTLPLELVGIMDQETYAKSKAYHMDKNIFSIVSSLWEQIFQTAVLLYNGLPLLWSLSGAITAQFGYGKDHEITQTIVSSLLGSIINSIFDLPLSVYYTFVLEEKYGFNKETPSFFFKDRIKKFVVMEAILLPILACIVHIIKIGGDYFFIYVWLFCVVISLFLITVWADYIAPLFDKFTPLEDGHLKEEIEKLASSISFPLKKIYVVEGSKRSVHSNAYYIGLFKNKRIVLFDTLLEDYGTSEKKESEDASEKPKVLKKRGCNTDEVVAVLAHELGHWRLSHVLKNAVILQVNMFILFAVFALLFKNPILYQAFGFKHDRPVIIGLVIIFQYILNPYNELLSFLMTSLSRRFEFQADAYAKILSKAADLRGALIKLNIDNLNFPVYDWLYTAWHHSHPPLLQRIEALGKID